MGAVRSYEFVNVNENHTISVTFKLVNTPPVESVDFNDVKKSAWYYEPVTMVSEKGETFKEQKFSDVAVDKYYASGVAWAAENGIVSGYGNNVFGPNDNITREQLALMLYNYAKYKGYNISVSGDLSVFADHNRSSDYALTAIKWAVGSSVMNGKNGGMLDPKGKATRAEVATMLMNLLGE